MQKLLTPRARAVSIAMGLTMFAGITLTACASSGTTASGAPQQQGAANMSLTPPSPDPRIGLKPGWFNAQEAAWNISLVSNTPPSENFINLADPADSRVWNSDLAFTGKYVIQGNFAGYQVWDVSDPARPRLHKSYLCIG